MNPVGALCPADETIIDPQSPGGKRVAQTGNGLRTFPTLSSGGRPEVPVISGSAAVGPPAPGLLLEGSRGKSPLRPAEERA